MRDEKLHRLFEMALGPFPEGLAGEEISGIDVVRLHELVFGVASHYVNNSRLVSAEHLEVIGAALTDLEMVLSRSPSNEARTHFAHARAVARYLVKHRAHP